MIAKILYSCFLMPCAFDNPDRLRELFAPPLDPSAEPTSNFPLAYYEHFLREIRRLNIQVITFRDLFEGSDDWNYRWNYRRERRRWKKARDRRAVYLVIQHDVDDRPFFTQRMVAMEALYGVRSNIFIFRDRCGKNGEALPYNIDHGFFQEAERRGFVIGYHQNALQLAGFDMHRAVERFRSDVAHLRTSYDIQFFVPHGGPGHTINGRMRYNLHVPMPPELEGAAGHLRWVYNGHGPKFSRKYTDGGVEGLRTRKRLAGLDLIGSFLEKLRPGTRSWALIHPQRWGYHVDPTRNPLLAQQDWYRRMYAEFGARHPDSVAAATSRGSARGSASQATEQRAPQINKGLAR